MLGPMVLICISLKAVSTFHTRILVMHECYNNDPKILFDNLMIPIGEDPLIMRALWCVTSNSMM